MNTSSQGDNDDGGSESAPVQLGADFIFPLLGCALTAYYLITTNELVWEAKITATIIGAVLLGLSSLQFIRMFARIASGTGTFGLGDIVANTPHNWQRLCLLLLVTLFLGAIQWIGTTPALFLLIVGCMLVLGVRSIKSLLITAFSASAAVYILLIYLLSSRLPTGPVEDYLAKLIAIGA